MSEQARMTPEERYRRDAQFMVLVDSLEAQLHHANFTPTEIREAAMLAAIHYDMKSLRPSYLRKEELDALRKL